jgi:uncharacterized protein YjiS (DUF1127 family)
MTCSDTLNSTATAPAARFVDGSRASTRVFSSVLRIAQAWRSRRRDRALLGAMPEYLLRDVGLDAATARFETDKPFWRG